MPTRRCSKRSSRAAAPGKARRIAVSLFDAMADWMTVPLLHHEGGKSPKRLGLVASLDLALWRVQVAGRRRHPDLDPERPRVAHPREGRDGRRGARRRSEVRHRHGAHEAPRRDRRQGRGRVRHDGCRRHCRRSSRPPTSRSRASTTWRASSRIRICAASASRRRAGRCRIRRRRRSATRRAAMDDPALGEHTEKVRKEFSWAILRSARRARLEGWHTHRCRSGPCFETLALLRSSA